MIALFGTSVRGLSSWSDEARLVNWQGMADLRRVLPMLHELEAGACVCAGEGSVLADVLPFAAEGREYWLCSSRTNGERDFETCELSSAFSDFYGTDIFVCTRCTTAAGQASMA